ncbi:hypothetical protein Tco_0009225 [Tanacetum coccineum]
MALGYQNPFYLKQAQRKQQSLYNGRVLLEKHDPPAVYDLEETLQLAQESRLKMKRLNKEIKPVNYAKINKLSEVFVSQKAKSREEVYFSNTFKMASVSNTISKSFSIPDDGFLDDTSSVAQKFLNEGKDSSKYTLDPLSQKLEDENVSLKFQVLNYAKENTHLKTIYKNLFESINVTRAQTKIITDSLQDKLNDTIYENAKNHLVVRQPNAFQSERPKFSKTWIPPKVVKTNDLSNPVTSNSVPTINESHVVENDKVIAPGMFKINSFKTFREEKYVPINQARVSVRTNPITVSQPHVIIKKGVNSNSNGLSSTGVNITAKTRRPQPRSNTKNDRVPSTSQSSCIKNKQVKVEDHHKNLLLSKNKKHMSSECNNIKLVIGIINLKLFVLYVSNV